MKKISIIAMSILLPSVNALTFPVKEIVSAGIIVATSRQIFINNYKANQLQQASINKIDTILHNKNLSELTQENLRKLRPCLPCSIMTEIVMDTTALSTIGIGYFGTLLATKHFNHALLMRTPITTALSIPFLLSSYTHLQYAQVNADLIEQEIKNPGSTSEQHNFIDKINLALTRSKDDIKTLFQILNKKN